MTFIQIHTLTSYPATLLNRDDQGFAKRITFGGSIRTRVSSQCLKYHWRKSHNLMDGNLQNQVSNRSIRSVMHFDAIYNDLKSKYTGSFSSKDVEEAVLSVKEALFPAKKSPSKKTSKAVTENNLDSVPETETETEDTEEAGSLKTNQVVVLGNKEVEYLTKLAEDILTGKVAKSSKLVQQNVKAMKESAGLDAGMFGRMVTSDMLSNVDAAIHVAHAFTTHAEQSEDDYFITSDDIKTTLGASHLGDTELNTGVFYGFVVVDFELLVKNVGGDRTLAKDLVKNLVNVISTTSPGAKKGPTAPYAKSSYVCVEVGTEQPRSLSEAFLEAVEPNVSSSINSLESFKQVSNTLYSSSNKEVVMSVNSNVTLNDVISFIDSSVQ